MLCLEQVSGQPGSAKGIFCKLGPSSQSANVDTLKPVETMAGLTITSISLSQ